MKISSVYESINSFAERLRRALMPTRAPRWMWVEVVVIMLCSVAIGLIWQRDKPFLTGGEFPWIWFAPVLLALRYGVLAGIASALMLIAAWQGMNTLTQGRANFPDQFFLGGLILAMLCGEFSTAWISRLRRAEESRHYLEERLSVITRRHLLLRLSHDRLEQEILTQPVTLRTALLSMRTLAAGQRELQLPALDALLQMLTRYCQLESAAIFIRNANTGEYLRAGVLGSPPDLPTADPMLLHALEHQTLAHLMIEGLEGKPVPSPFLVVAPIVTCSGVTLGVLAIERMPLLALNQENLQMLAVLIAYYADCVADAGSGHFLRHQLVSAPADFTAELARLLRLQREYGINSFIVLLSFANDEQGRQAVMHLARFQRILDIPWQVETARGLLFANLMPLAGVAAVEGYLLRIESILQGNLGDTSNQWGMKTEEINLAAGDSIDFLVRAIRRLET